MCHHLSGCGWSLLSTTCMLLLQSICPVCIKFSKPFYFILLLYDMSIFNFLQHLSVFTFPVFILPLIRTQLTSELNCKISLLVTVLELLQSNFTGNCFTEEQTKKTLKRLLKESILNVSWTCLKIAGVSLCNVYNDRRRLWSKEWLRGNQSTAGSPRGRIGILFTLSRHIESNSIYA